jgi:hypothetical protein
MKYEEVRDDRQMRALTGLTIGQFENLAIEFEVDYQKQQQEAYIEGIAEGTRQRRPGGGSKGRLPNVKDKLFFTLVYFKTYPTFDVLGTQFGMGRSKANENLHKLAPILSKTLVRLGIMPHREFFSVAEMKAAFKDVDRVIAHSGDADTGQNLVCIKNGLERFPIANMISTFGSFSVN